MRSMPPRRSSSEDGRKSWGNGCPSAADGSLDKTTVGGARRPPRRRYGNLAGRRAVFRLLGPVPDRPDRDPRLSKPGGSRRRAHPRQLPSAHERCRDAFLWVVDQAQPHYRPDRGNLRLSAGAGRSRSGGCGPRLRSALSTFSGVASNFAGVPLAAAFIFTLGRIGLVTAAFELFGVDLYDSGFSLYSFWGLTLVYLYFQIPLMVLGHPAGAGWVEKGLAGGSREPGCHPGTVLASCGACRCSCPRFWAR